MEAAWQSEVDPHATKVLAQHWPGVPNLGDITAIDWHDVEPVDIITGGFPCQDISLAGKGAGIKDGTRSGLWSYFADAIGVLRPRYVFIENVSALAVRGLDRVLCDLAEVGFDAEWVCLRASDVGAPHRRERLFCLATNTDSVGWEGWTGSRSEQTRWGQLAHSDLALADSTSNRWDEGRAEPTRVQGRLDVAQRSGSTPSDTLRHGCERDKKLNSTSSVGLDGQHRGHVDRRSLEDQRDTELGKSQVAWGNYELAIRRWEAITRTAPPAVDERGRLDPRFAEWMMGFPEGWVESIPRNQQLKCVGNAVVPQCGAEALRQLLQAG